MKNQNNYDIRKYYTRFDEIIKQMASRMLAFNTSSNITINFIECMIPHHEAAIYMSDNLLNYTKYKPLCEIANNIIRMQTSGVAQMKEIVKTTQTCANYPRDVVNMISKMKNSPRLQNINLSFTYEMIPHHEGAIEMCNNLLQYPIDPRLRLVAETIIREQSHGIIELKKIQGNISASC